MYTAVLAAQHAAVAALVPGAPLSASHAAAAAVLQEQLPADVAARLGKVVGFATGIELRESKLQLSASNDTVVQAGMLFNVSVGLAGLTRDNAPTPKDRCEAPWCVSCPSLPRSGLRSEWGGGAGSTLCK